MERLCSKMDVHVVSLYDQEKLVEEDLAATLRSHRCFLAPSGQYDNPFWLPPALTQGASSDAQLQYLSGHCQRSLAIDPTDVNGNIEVIRVLLAQGRQDAVERHYKQFERVSEENGVPIESTVFFEEYQELTAQWKNNSAAE